VGVGVAEARWARRRGAEVIADGGAPASRVDRATCERPEGGCGDDGCAPAFACPDGCRPAVDRVTTGATGPERGEGAAAEDVGGALGVDRLTWGKAEAAAGDAWPGARAGGVIGVEPERSARSRFRIGDRGAAAPDAELPAALELPVPLDPPASRAPVDGLRLSTP
jgi:hypothetical protein